MTRVALAIAALVPSGQALAALLDNGSGSAFAAADSATTPAVIELSVIVTEPVVTTEPAVFGGLSDIDADRFAGAMVGAYVGRMAGASKVIPIETSSIAPVPLPAAFWLLGSALVGLVGICRRRAG